MLVFEKEYFTFDDLEKRWGANRGDLDYLVLSTKLVPSIFLEECSAGEIVFAEGEKLFPSDPDYVIENEDLSGYAVPLQFYFLREPKRLSLSEYRFHIGCSDPVAKKEAHAIETWCRFHKPVHSFEKNIVFLKTQVINFEKEESRKHREIAEMETERLQMRERMAILKASRMKENSVDVVTIVDEISEPVLHNTHLMKMAIEVQKEYWPTLDSKPKQETVINEIIEKYKISKPEAQAVERVACPVDRTKQNSTKG